MAKQYALILGILSLVLGILGFLLPETGSIAEALAPTVWSNLLFVVTGIVGLAVSSTEEGSNLAARVIGIVYTILAIIGLFTDDVLGLVQATLTNEIILWVIAVLSLIVGFGKCQCNSSNG